MTIVVYLTAFVVAAFLCAKGMIAILLRDKEPPTDEDVLAIRKRLKDQRRK